MINESEEYILARLNWYVKELRKVQSICLECKYIEKYKHGDRTLFYCQKQKSRYSKTGLKRVGMCNSTCDLFEEGEW